MRNLSHSLLLAFAISALPAFAQQTAAISTASTATASSSEMQRIFDEDQAARQNALSFSKAQGVALYKADVARRAAVQKLLDAGDLHTGQDFEEAAFIFQHGNTADDYVLAHTLATLAVAKGRASAVWIMTATLDRYLQKIGQPQIYGSQYLPHPDGQWTQEPYNRTLISDSLLHQLGVPSRANQEKQLEMYRKQAQ